MESNKMIATLKSRKFWASVVSLLVSLGVVAWSESQATAVTDSIVTLVGALAPVLVGAVYVISTAIEDAANARARAAAGQTDVPPKANQNG